MTLILPPKNLDLLLDLFYGETRRLLVQGTARPVEIILSNIDSYPLSLSSLLPDSPDPKDIKTGVKRLDTVLEGCLGGKVS